jgi:hypothetical protein
MEKMRKAPVILFFAKLALYLSVAGLVTLHPGILVSYDRNGVFLWFIIIPLEALIAFFPAPGGRPRSKVILALFPLVIIPFWTGGLGLDALGIFGAGLLSFTLTFLLFHYPRLGKLAVLEPFFLVWMCLRLLAFSRSGEEASGQSLGLTQFILVWTLIVFLFQNAIIYFCLYPKSLGGINREGTLCFLVGSAALFAVFFLLPPDFVRNTIIDNLLPDQVDNRLRDMSDYGLPEEGQRDGDWRETIPRDRNGGRAPRRQGLAESDWPGESGSRGSRGNNGGEGGESRQYAVMVVASKQDPVYMGDAFRGRFDPAEGFLLSPDESLNQLPSQRLFTTWFDSERLYDRKRTRQEVFSLSTLSQRYLPYRPYAVEPTVLSESSGPFRYIHTITANTHNGDPLELVGVPIREMNASERTRLSPYLELPLGEGDMALFSEYLAAALEDWRENRETIIQNDLYLLSVYEGAFRRTGNEHMEKIIALLLYFRTYQYDLQNNDDSSVGNLKSFLFETMNGDCVEFSNSLALLGRLAGIPSRVVTGYLAAQSLQTMAHRRGIAALQNQIPVLREFPLRDLYLVTNMHAHSWTQFYIPDYGWLDFEATAFAIPPIGGGDFNSWDVVIPIIDPNRTFSASRPFPWRPVLRVIALLLALALAGAYALRYGREALLFFSAKRGGREGARSLYLLLLARLAAEGKPFKPASKTALEYSELFPETGEDFTAFAAIYGELRWREFKDSAEKEEGFSRLKQSYKSILASARRRGFVGLLRRIFSLRGLFYL